MLYGVAGHHALSLDVAHRSVVSGDFGNLYCGAHRFLVLVVVRVDIVN